VLTQNPQEDILQTENLSISDSDLLTQKVGSFRFVKQNWPLILLTVLAYLGRLATVPDFIESRDGLLFLRGIEHYSVVELRPQWPGYPVYIWAGKLFGLLYNNPILALHMVSILASTLTLWPIAKLALLWYRFLKPGESSHANWVGLTAALAWVLLPLSWLGGSEIFSDPLGLLIGLTFFWLACRSIENRPGSALYLPVAGLLAGLMLGTRLSYLVLLLPLVYAVWINRSQPVFGWKKGPLLLPLAVALCFGLAVTLWLGWQLLMDGWKYFQAGDTHLVGHYTEWGGSVSTDKNILTRPLRMFETLAVYGLGSWWPGLSFTRLPTTFGLLALLVSGTATLARRKLSPPLLMALLWVGPYFAWILLGNDVDLARYEFPLVALLCILVGLGLPSRKWVKILAIPVISLCMALVTVPQALEHHTHPPVGEQLATYASQNSGDAAFIVNDDTSPLIFFLVDEAPESYSLRVATPDLEKETANLEKSGHTVYVTALPGTALPGNNWVPVARFCRGKFMESRGPLEVWLYQHNPAATASLAPLQCEPYQAG